MRRMSEEVGENMGDEFNEVVHRLERGEDPESIEAAMPGLAGDMDGGMSGGMGGSIGGDMASGLPSDLSAGDDF